jgi:hypothetical protein
VNSDSEMTDSSRYAATCSFTPGWSRAIWPDDTPRMATWLWPGPRFCTLKPATSRATPSMSSMPRERRSASVGAATEKGVSCTVVSRFMAVTVTSSSPRGCREKSALPPPAPTSTLFVSFPKPLSETATVYAPVGTVAE